MAWAGMVATVLWNYREHRRGRPTICSVTRHVVPEWVFRVLWALFSRWMERHIVEGYEPRG